MADRPFETVAEAERRARVRLPKPVYLAMVAGAEKGVTMNDNVAAFDELGFAPLLAGKPAKRDLSVTVLGQQLAMPVLTAPTGVRAVYPAAEVAVVAAAHSRGLASGLSAFASRSIEDAIAANPLTLQQIYWSGTRDQILARLDRAKRAGAVGLIVTLDWSFSHGRDWGSPVIPTRIGGKEVLKYASKVLTKPVWFARWARTGAVPPFSTPNMAVGDGPVPTFMEAYSEWAATPPPTWEDLAWLCTQWEGPLMLKGIVRVDDAKRAVDAGATAISVSNHAGNNLDGTPATIRALPAIAAAVGDSVEVLLDGGIRRGGDVVKALALGAKAVMVGRAALWGLAAGGQAGVEAVLDILRDGTDSTMYALGRANVGQLRPDDILVPAGFTRRMGAED